MVLPYASKRLEICLKCPKLGVSLLGGKCIECGCFLALKVIAKTSKCPLGKWELEND